MKKIDWDKAFGECPEEFHNSVNSALSKISNREEKNMSRISLKKKVIITAAAVMAIGVTAVAAGKVASITGHSYLDDMVYSIEEIQAESDKENFDVKYPETLGGYAFEKGLVGEGDAADEEGNKRRDYNFLNLDYANGDKYASLYVEPIADITDMPEDKPCVDIDGITVYTIEQVFKFVPPDYEKTEQDIKDEEAGKLVFSYGTEDVEVKTMRQVTWEEGNLVFDIIAGDDTVDMDTLVDMAEDMIRA